MPNFTPKNKSSSSSSEVGEDEAVKESSLNSEGKLLILDFQAAAGFVKKSPDHQVNVSDSQKLTLYGLFKQVTCGPNKTPKPGVLSGIVKRAKWKAWSSFKNVSREEAAKQYIQVVRELAPDWVPPSQQKTKKEAVTSSSGTSSSLSSDLLDFQAAAGFVKKNSDKVNVSDTQKLTLYGLFKQATCGTNKTPKPGVLGGFVKRAKWKAWSNFKSMSREDAAKQYVRVVRELAPDWIPPSQQKTQKESSAASSSSSSSSSSSASEDEADENDKEKVRKISQRVSSGDFARMDGTFNQACSHFMASVQHTASEEEKHIMYGLFKQSTVGSNNTPKPSMMSGMEKRAKWKTWSQFKTMSKLEAKKQYISQVKRLDPSWTPETAEDDDQVELGENKIEDNETNKSSISEENVDLALKFKKACTYVCNTPSLLDHKGSESDMSLELYGLWKRGTIGPNRAAKPSVMMSGVKRSKWKAWTRCNGMDQDEARRRYIQITDKHRAKKQIAYKPLMKCTTVIEVIKAENLRASVRF